VEPEASQKDQDRPEVPTASIHIEESGHSSEASKASSDSNLHTDPADTKAVTEGSQAVGPATMTDTKPLGDQIIFPHNLEHDGHTLDGMLVLSCFFCNTFHTPIEIDMRVHLRDSHQKDLVIRLPLQGKGFDLNYRTQLAIDIMKQKTPQIFYDHRTAKFAPSPYTSDTR
jgi:hypothetical protein